MEIKICKLDDTEHWLDDKLKTIAGRIFAVYLFAPAIRVHACELAASYELHYIGEVIEGTAAYAELSDDAREEIAEQLRDGARETEDVTYMHVSDVERLPTLEHDTDTAQGVATFGDFGDEINAIDDARETVRIAIDDAREHAFGNGYVDT